MKPVVSIIMGSTSDLPVMEKAAKFFDEMEIPFEINALSAHRTPDAVEAFAKGAKERGIKVIIAGAGMAAALPGVYWRACEGKCIGWCGCCLFDVADASRHSGGNGCYQWCLECRYSCCADVGTFR